LPGRPLAFTSIVSADPFDVTFTCAVAFGTHVSTPVDGVMSNSIVGGFACAAAAATIQAQRPIPMPDARIAAR